MLDYKGVEVFLCFAFLRFVMRAFDFRQANARRCIRKRKPKKRDANQSNRRRHEETDSPAEYHEITAEYQNYRAADRMRDIPERHLCRQLFWREPVRD